MCVQRCGVGGQRNTSQMWQGLDGQQGLSNQGRCLVAAPAAAGFSGERLIIADEDDGSGQPCQWKLVSPTYAHPPDGSEKLVPHLIIGQPPNSTDHCSNPSNCIQEALDGCRQRFVEALTEPKGQSQQNIRSTAPLPGSPASPFLNYSWLLLCGQALVHRCERVSQRQLHRVFQCD